ncbi:MAG: 30S ribosomal protein S20 [Planctomycetes bacterium]|nr:30S ribosomal protein S20 [Planctomycetota bacterium]
MPNRPSAMKRLRQDKKKRERNKAIKSRLRTEQNRFDRMMERGDLQEAEQQASLLTKLLQRAAHKNILHVNKAARKQAQFQSQLNELRQVKSASS